MEQKLEKVIKARLVATAMDGAYETYVFQDMNSPLDFHMCTRCPNWTSERPELLQEGFLSFKDVIAGRDTYYDKLDGCHRAYQYTATYFINFVPITHVLKDGYVVDKSALIVS